MKPYKLFSFSFTKHCKKIHLQYTTNNTLREIKIKEGRKKSTSGRNCIQIKTLKVIVSLASTFPLCKIRFSQQKQEYFPSGKVIREVSQWLLLKLQASNTYFYNLNVIVTDATLPFVESDGRTNSEWHGASSCEQNVPSRGTRPVHSDTHQNTAGI